MYIYIYARKRIHTYTQTHSHAHTHSKPNLEAESPHGGKWQGCDLPPATTRSALRTPLPHTSAAHCAQPAHHQRIHDKRHLDPPHIESLRARCEVVAQDTQCGCAFGRQLATYLANVAELCYWSCGCAFGRQSVVCRGSAFPLRPSRCCAQLKSARATARCSQPEVETVASQELLLVSESSAAVAVW